ncbi:hypothetical protein [Streptosporangium sp. NPDC000396]|uniref:zinc finger domain-containing protein n=1 Tax=Streptosporangium sp. NPDC000396 TaxID=3366185 RepID=UPI0036AE286E
MEPAPEEAAAEVERHDCPTCEAPAPNPCRTRGGKVAAKYHAARFILVPSLRERGVPIPEIARKLIIKTGKNAGKNPSVASLYRALADADVDADA